MGETLVPGQAKRILQAQPTQGPQSPTKPGVSDQSGLAPLLPIDPSDQITFRTSRLPTVSF